jgi:hypothetical protein
MKLTHQHMHTKIEKMVAGHIMGLRRPGEVSPSRTITLHGGAGDEPAKPGKDAKRMLRRK